MLPYLVTASLRQRLDLIAHLLAFGRQLVVVSGAPGSGRTRLLATLAGEVEASCEVITLDGRGCADGATLLARLHGALAPPGVEPPPDLDERVDAVRACVRQSRARQRQVVALIDDADELADDAVAILLDLAQRGDELDELRVVIGVREDDALVARLEAAAPHAALVHVVSVPPLDEARLVELGEAWCEERDLPESVVSASTLAEIARAGDGNPGRFLAALGAYLDAGAGSARAWPRFVPSAGLKRGAGIAVVLLAAIGLVALALHDREGERVPAERGPAIIELKLPPAPPDVAPAAEARPAAQRADGTRRAVAPDPVQAPVTPEALETPEAPGTAEAPETPETPKPSETTKPSETREAPATAESSEIPEETEEAEKASAIAVEPTPPARRDTPPAPSGTVADSTDYTSEWVLTNADARYVIQLFGARSRDAVATFRRRHGLDGRTAVFELTHENAPWYVLVYGLYADRAAAARAIAALPAAQRSAGAWPRSVGSLRK